MKTFLSFLLIWCFSIFVKAQPGNNFGVSQSIFIPVETTFFYKVGDRTVPIKVTQYGTVKNIVCINLHANEQTSVHSAYFVLESYGGTLIKIENNNQRVIRFRLKGVYYSFDPNRMFSRIGIEQTLRDNRKTSKEAIDEIEKFAQRLLLLIPDSTSCIVALHNNTDGAYSVKSYLPGSERHSDAKAVYADPTQDIDDIALTTDSLLYEKMAENNFNCIWQDNINAKKDGSLSIFCGEQKRRYINIETQHGKAVQYKKMLEKFLEILAEENKIIPEETITEK